MPRFSPWTASDTIPIRSTAPETANQYFVRPMKSTRCQAGIFWALAPMNAGLLNQRKPARTPRRARVTATAVTIEISVPMMSMRAKPFTPPVATAKRTNAVMIVTTFASTIVLKPLR